MLHFLRQILRRFLNPLGGGKLLKVAILADLRKAKEDLEQKEAEAMQLKLNVAQNTQLKHNSLSNYHSFQGCPSQLLLSDLQLRRSSGQGC